jgi:hypothetical protein
MERIKNQKGYVLTKRVIFESRVPSPYALSTTVLAAAIFDGTSHCSSLRCISS